MRLSIKAHVPILLKLLSSALDGRMEEDSEGLAIKEIQCMRYMVLLCRWLMSIST